MRPGLRIVCIGGGAYEYIAIGWVAHHRGDFYDLHTARVLRRFGGRGHLTEMAAKGPYKGDSPTILLDPSAEPEEICALIVRRAIPCNAEAWADEGPCPASWKEATGQ